MFNFTAENIRKRYALSNKISQKTVIKRVKQKIRLKMRNVAAGIEDYNFAPFVEVYGEITDDIVKYFEDRGFKVTVFYKKNGIRVSWDKGTNGIEYD